MFILSLPLFLGKVPPPSERPSDDPAHLRQQEHEFRLRLAGVHAQVRSLAQDERTYDLSVEKLHSEERELQSEIDAVASARRRIRREGQTDRTTEASRETQFAAQSAQPAVQTRAERRKGLVRSLSVASGLMFVGLLTMIVRVSMLPKFKHKKDEDLPGSTDRRTL
jgi:hypothetical protein